MLFLLGGCDDNPSDLVREIVEAREGCTEDGLKTSAEECVQMFERYADMGADAMVTYIGAMKAFDAAIGRRGGLSFDTTGLGRVFTPSVAGDSLAPASSFQMRERADFETEAERSDFGPGAGLAPSWGVVGTGGGPDSAEGRTNPWSAPRAGPGDVPRRAERGRLLPPGDRLQRPWIAGDDPTDDYLDLERPGPPAPSASGGFRYPREEEDPYRYDPPPPR